METAARSLVILAAVPANLIPMLYATRPWYGSLAGRWVMVSSIGMALLVDAAILFWIMPDFPGRDVLRLVVYAVIMLGLWTGLFTIIRYRHMPTQPHRRSTD